jgi:membrane fusion protein, heavy metal efflux system
LFRIVDPSRLQITANVPPADATRVRTGDRVELVTNDGQMIQGRVRSATGVVDPRSRAATVVVTPAAGSSVLLPGQLVQARIFASGGATPHGVMVPQDAIQSLGDQSVVFVRTRGGFRAQAVKLGARSSGMVGIIDGLTVGTPIATANAFLLKAELEKESAQ